MNALFLNQLASLGTVTFRLLDEDRHQCRWTASLEHYQGQNVVVDEDSSFEAALERVFQTAVKVGFIEGPRIIQRTMTDGISTKDGVS